MSGLCTGECVSCSTDGSVRDSSHHGMKGRARKGYLANQDQKVVEIDDENDDSLPSGVCKQ